LATPPVVWKTTEEDGNPSVVATALVSFPFFSSLLEAKVPESLSIAPVSAD
jgi:hypothetical protein